MRKAALGGGTLPPSRQFASAREAARLLAQGDVMPVGETVRAVSGNGQGKLEAQVVDLVAAARALDAAVAAHWPPLKQPLHTWENTAASIPGVQLTHGILAQLEPELAEQLAKPQRAQVGDGR